MSSHIEILRRLAEPTDSKIIMLIMDGVGDIHTAASPRTSLELAATPNLDALAARSALGRSLPVDCGVTPGSGPGHMGLFGYDPALEQHQIGRGVLEALGIDYDMKPGEIAARGNFATIGADGLITDRRAGRPNDEECRRVCAKLGAEIKDVDGIKVNVLPVREHRFCVTFDGPGLDANLEDTDPQKVGAAPLPARASKPTPAAERARAIVQGFIDRAFKVLADEPKINALTLRGFSSHPALPNFNELYHLKPAAVAYYPLYRGVARLAGMKILNTGPTPDDQFRTVAENWAAHDFFFIHIKKTDSSGEDGDQAAKIAAIEKVDKALPILTGLNPAVLCVTGDHSTPTTMKGHSWHPVPLLINAETADIDATTRYTETECLNGSIGTIPSSRILGLLLANAGKLAKYGA